jgi:hypothetical protein
VGPTASATEVEEDVNGGPPGVTIGGGGVRQHPPPRLKMTSMAGPVASTTEVEDIIDGGPPGGIVGGFGSIHHRG